MRPSRTARTPRVSWWDVVVWGGVLIATALWSVVAVMSLLELMSVHTAMSYVGWVWLTWVAAGWSMAFAVTSCLVPMLGGIETCCGTLQADTAARRRQPLKLHWTIYTLCTSLCAIAVSQFYSHYTEAELRLLTLARDHPTSRPVELDLLVLVHWRELHVLNLVVWMLLLVAAFMLNINQLIIDGPLKSSAASGMTVRSTPST